MSARAEYAETYVEGSDLFAVYDDDAEALIDPHQIREAGWMRHGEQDPCERHHCDMSGEHGCICGPPASDVTETLRMWHNDTHIGTFQFCDQSPCSEVRNAMRSV